MTDVQRLVDILETPKMLAPGAVWRLLDVPKAANQTPPARQRVEFAAALERDGVVLSGVSLRIAAFRFRPDEQVAVMMMVRNGTRLAPFQRIDWRGALHTNRRADAPHFLHDAGASHIHGLVDNAVIGLKQAMSENLPVATAISPPESFRELMTLSATEFGIPGLEEIGSPPWEHTLT